MTLRLVTGDTAATSESATSSNAGAPRTERPAHKTEGGSEPVPQDPAQIQRQIEDTRAELAQTIDAIADIVSPKRAARRGVEQLRGMVEELRSRGNGPAALLDGQSQRELPAGMSPQLQGSSVYGTKRAVRWDRVAIVGGGALVLVLIIRRRRHHS